MKSLACVSSLLTGYRCASFFPCQKKRTEKVHNLWTTMNKLRVIHKQDFLFPFEKKQSNCFSTFPPGGKGSCQNLFHKKRRLSKNNLSTTPGGNMFSTVCSNFILFFIYQSLIQKSFVDKNKTTLGRWNIKILPCFFPNTIPGHIPLLLFFILKQKQKKKKVFFPALCRLFLCKFLLSTFFLE